MGDLRPPQGPEFVLAEVVVAHRGGEVGVVEVVVVPEGCAGPALGGGPGARLLGVDGGDAVVFGEGVGEIAVVVPNVVGGGEADGGRAGAQQVGGVSAAGVEAAVEFLAGPPFGVEGLQAADGAEDGYLGAVTGRAVSGRDLDAENSGGGGVPHFAAFSDDLVEVRGRQLRLGVDLEVGHAGGA